MMLRCHSIASNFLIILTLFISCSFIHDAEAKSPLTRNEPQFLQAPIPPPLESKAKDMPVLSVNPTEAVAKNVMASYLGGFEAYAKDMVTGGLTWKEVVFTFLAIAAVALSCSAMILEASLLVDVLAWTCVILGPSAAILQRKVSLLESLREITNQLREQVSQVSANNAILQTQNMRLAKNTKKLQKSQTALSQISEANGMTVDKLVKQVNEYKLIQADIKTDLRSKVQQTLLNIFLKSDRDDDFVIDPEEIDRLILRLKNIPGVEFNEAKFRRVLKNEGGDIMQFADKHFGNEVAVDKENIFTF